MQIDIVEGWTGNLDFQLLADDVAVDLTGIPSVELVLIGSDTSVVDTSADTSVFDAVGGKVRYSPDPTDLDDAKSPYTARWKVTDGAGKVVFFPSGAWDFFNVRRP